MKPFLESMVKFIYPVRIFIFSNSKNIRVRTKPDPDEKARILSARIRFFVVEIIDPLNFNIYLPKMNQNNNIPILFTFFIFMNVKLSGEQNISTDLDSGFLLGFYRFNPNPIFFPMVCPGFSESHA